MSRRSRTQKHTRLMLKTLESEGWDVVVIGAKGHGHDKIKVTLGDGRVGRFPMSGSPKNPDHAIKSTVRQIRLWERSGQNPTKV